MQASDVVFVVLDRVEGRGTRQVGKTRMNASAAPRCAERHFELFEIVVIQALLELAEKKVVRDQILVRKAGRIDRLDLGQVGNLALMACSRSAKRVIAELVVVAIVADSSRLRGIHLESGLPRVVKKGVLSSQARGHRGRRLS